MERQSKGSREAWRRIVKGAKAHPGGCSAIEEEENSVLQVVASCFFRETSSIVDLGHEQQGIYIEN